jgi:hypothetical protein
MIRVCHDRTSYRFAKVLAVNICDLVNFKQGIKDYNSEKVNSGVALLASRLKGLKIGRRYRLH